LTGEGVRRYLRHIFAMTLGPPPRYLSDRNAERARAILEERLKQAGGAPGEGNKAQMALEALFEDRAARSALIMRLARGLTYARRRFNQAREYLDGILHSAHKTTTEPWPDEGVCLTCGATVAGATTGTSRLDKRVLIHADGTRCKDGLPVRE
jgi:hypothetical protein